MLLIVLALDVNVNQKAQSRRKVFAISHDARCCEYLSRWARKNEYGWRTDR